MKYILINTAYPDWVEELESRDANSAYQEALNKVGWFIAEDDSDDDDEYQTMEIV